MSSTQTGSEQASQIPRAGTVDMTLEVVVLPVSNVDRAKRFYGGLGWRPDADIAGTLVVSSAAARALGEEASS